MKIVRLLYRQAVERWPGSKWAADAQERLARMYIHIGDYEKADAAAKRCCGRRGVVKRRHTEGQPNTRR